MATKRRDTRLEAEGAEFLVLGQLLIEGIHAFKAYTNFPGWDLIAVNPDRGLEKKIQVKSRWQTGAKAFPIKNFACDFVAFVCLNRGRRQNPLVQSSPPDIYVLPIQLVEPGVRDSGGWSRFSLLTLPDPEKYRNNWQQLRKGLRLPPKPTE